MSDQLLINVFRVPVAGDLAPLASVTLPHGLVSNGADVPPTLVQPDRASTIVVTAVTDTTVTFRNLGAAPAYALFRCERGLSVEVDAETVTPSLWQGAASGGGGGGIVGIAADAPLAVADPAGPITTVSLNNSGVAAGDYGVALPPGPATESLLPQITVSAKGLITAASQAPITIGGDGAKTYVDNAAAAAQAAAEAYAESLAFGIASKEPAHVATTEPLPVYGVTGSGTILTASDDGVFPDIDGQTVAVGERVLVKNEIDTDQPNNGIYALTDAGSALTKWVLTRTSDADTAQELCGALESVETGTVNGGTLWLFAANALTFTLGTTPVIWQSLAMPNATTSSPGAVQLAGGLGGAGTVYNSPKLDMGSATSGTLAVTRGGTGVGSLTGYGAVVMNSTGTAATSVVPGGSGNVLTSDGTSWTSAAPAVASVSVDHTYFVATNGNDVTGDGSLTKPFASIQRAITAANTQPVGTKVRIDVAPGTYATGTKITLGRYNTFIQGAGDRPEEQVTQISDPIEIDCSTATLINNQQVSIDGCFVQPSGLFTEPAVSVIGSGQFTTVVTNSYLTTTNAASSASAFSVANINARTILWNGVATVQAAAAAAPVLKYAGGTHRLSDFQVLHGGSVGAAATSNGIAVSGLSYLFADRVLVETVTNQPAITLAGTAYGANTSKAALSNVGITTTGATSDGISHTATGLVVLVTDAFFTVPSARTCIIGAAGCPTAIGQLSFAPSASTTLSIALPAYNSETHGAMFLPSVSSASAPLKVDANRKVVTGTIGPTEGGTGLTSYAAGDLIYASGVNTLAKLGVGTAGQVLVVSGGLPVWQTGAPPGGAAGGILGYTGSTYPNPNGLSGFSGADSRIPLKPGGAAAYLDIRMDSVAFSAVAAPSLSINGSTNTSTGPGGLVGINAGGNSSTGVGGALYLNGGTSQYGTGGEVRILSGIGGAASVGATTSGSVAVGSAETGGTIGTSGTVSVYSGSNVKTTGNVTVSVGTRIGTGGTSGTLTIRGGNTAVAGQTPGNVVINSGSDGTSLKGNVSIDGNAFPNTTLATGDMLYASASGVLSARTIGSTGDVLTVNGSGVPVWSPPAAAPSGLVDVPGGSFTFTNGKAVAIDSTGALALASATDLTAAPAVGLYVAGSPAFIRVAGVMTGLSGLVAGTAYYLSTTPGELTSTPPNTTGNVVQYIGRATSTTALFVSPATIVIA